MRVLGLGFQCTSAILRLVNLWLIQVSDFSNLRVSGLGTRYETPLNTDT